MAKNQSILKKEDLTFFEKYINNYSPTGYEVQGQKLWLDFVKPYIDEHYVDNYGTVYGVINPKADFKLVIEAHADEISWVVNYISDEGFIYVKRNGGADHIIAPSKRVVIHTKKGNVPALFGWPAIHVRKETKEETPQLKNIFLDLGCDSKKEVEKLGVHVGCVVTYQDEFMTLNKKYFVGRAMDNRAGGFMIALIAKLLKQNKKKLPIGLYIVNSAQEEVGLRGAEMIANRIKPNAAIITDVSHDTTTPMIDKKIEGDYKCGDGPVITYAPAVHNQLRELIVETAEKNKIPFQRDVASRGTGTDTDAFAYSNGGIPSALISLPLRYMHTTVESIAKSDLEHVVNLMYHTILSIKPNMSFKYF